MKMIAMKCPSCGANLQLKVEDKEAVCPYCETRLFISDEKSSKVEEAEKEGYAFEKGRQRAQKELHDSRAASQPKSTQSTQAHKEYTPIKKPSPWYKNIFIIGIINVLIGIFMFLMIFSKSGILANPIQTICGICFIIVGIVTTVFHRNSSYIKMLMLLYAGLTLLNIIFSLITHAGGFYLFVVLCIIFIAVIFKSQKQVS